MNHVEPGQVLWTPPASFVEGSNLHRFRAWLAARHGPGFDSYDALWHWSVEAPDLFWRAVWDYFGMMSDTAVASVRDGAMPGTRWFTGTRVNYAEHVLRAETGGDPGRAAITHGSEIRAMGDTSWRALSSAVRRVATALRDLGIRPGDRVVSYMPNIVETAIAMLATTAIGGVWAAAAPEFGVETVVDRFAQIEPKLIFAADGYRYGGKDFDRTAAVGQIVGAVPSIETVVWLGYLAAGAAAPDTGRRTVGWSALAARDDPGDDFAFERVASDHPLWILFTSGTTGLPKAIVHGHHGILVEACKSAAFHQNIKAGDCLFFYSTTGWMMWNTLFNALLMDGRAVLYDGHPSQPDPAVLWEIADRVGATHFGTSPTVTQIMRQQGLRPRDRFAFARMESLMLVGSPATPESFAWVYENVKPDLWVTSQSGGTEFCSGLIGSVPELPVRAGVIEAPLLGVDVDVVDEAGNSVRQTPGELVVKAPMPSMPLCMWGDTDGQRYRDAYFDERSHVWRHGDLAQAGADGWIIFGRSDATLNRFGVRIGTAEIYRTLENIPQIADSLVACIDEPGGGFYMPLFVTTRDGAELDAALRLEIVHRLRSERSPRHVPDEIIQAPGIPFTLTGKRMEVPVRKLLLGMPLDKAASAGSARDPNVLRWFAEFAAKAHWRRAP
jgi:acetoacetyl-CoA synthetase